jgi:hypothetical protein
MSTHNPKFHTIDPDGTIILHSKHLGEVVEVYIDKEKRRFYGIKKDGERIEDGIRKNGERIDDDSDCGNDFAQPVMLYKIWYHFEKDTWVAAYQLKHTKEDKQTDGFKTAREAWLYREALISGGIAEK